MRQWLLAAVALAVVSAGGWAQDVQQGQEKVAFEKKSYPFEGEVSVERLNVRMFPKNDQTSIITSVLGLGEKVTVVAEKDEYYQIMPPKGSIVWVAAKNIKREGDKGVAGVSDIPVRLDSRVNADVLCSLKEGDSVKVIGEHMGWLKIEAPAAVKYFVGKKYVHLGKELDATANVGVEAPKKTGGAKKEAPAPAAAGADAEAIALINSAKAELARQDRLIDEKKFAQIDFTSVVADFEAAKAKAHSDAVRSEAEKGLERYREINRIWETAKAQHKLRDEADARARAEAASKTPEKSMLFQGYVDNTGILFKRPGTHKLVMGGRILAFLRVKDGDEKMLTKLNDNFQKLVGINGVVIDNPEGWDGYKVVVVDELVSLEKKKDD